LPSLRVFGSVTALLCSAMFTVSVCRSVAIVPAAVPNSASCGLSTMTVKAPAGTPAIE
jgi:hypothetical protein